MKSSTPLDYAVFQLSPKCSRCELFVTSDGRTEKVASGFLKPFVSHLQVAEEQVASAAHSIKLEVGRHKNAEMWFTKGTLEMFVRFVSTPEVLELVNTFDAEMSQLEAARRIYSQGAGDQLSGGGGSGVTAGDDATKKELLRAIDVRLVAVRQDLSTACARAATAGFSIDTVSELQLFADKFGAHRLNEACAKFISLNERRPELTQPWRSWPDDGAVRSSYGSDMSIDDNPPSPPCGQQHDTCQKPDPPDATFPVCRTFNRESSVETEAGNKPNEDVAVKDSKDGSSLPDQTGTIQASQPARRLSVQDRINMFENKQKENSGGKPVVVKPIELRRLSSDLSPSGAAAERTVLRRWSGASDMSIDLSADKKDAESPVCAPTSAVISHEKKVLNLNDDAAEISSVANPEIKVIPSMERGSDKNKLKGVSFNNSEHFFEPNMSNSDLGSGESEVLKDQFRGKTRSNSFISRADDLESSEDNFRTLTTCKIFDAVGFGSQGKSKASRSGEELIDFQAQMTESKDESLKEIRVKATQKAVVDSGLAEGGPGSRILKAFACRYKGLDGDYSSSQQEARFVGETEAAKKKGPHMSGKVSRTSVLNIEATATGKTEVAEKKEPYMSERVSSTPASNFENSGHQTLKFNTHGLAAELSKKARVQRDNSRSSGNSRAQSSGQIVIEAQKGVDSFSAPPPEQAERVRQSKGNHELNEELKMKASELEKLFAEHGLRVPGDQYNSAHRGRSGETQSEPSSSLHYEKPVTGVAPQLSDGYQSSEPSRFSKNSTKPRASSPMKAVDQYDSDTINGKFSDLCVSESSRGKFYDRYIQKRDAKLREDWSANRAEKEAKLKFMQDSLERNRSEMKAKISGSADRQDSASSAQRRAERLRSYNSRSIMKREKKHLDFGNSGDDDEALDSPEQTRLHENKVLDDASSRDGICRVAQGKKHLPHNRSSSSTPRTSAAPVPRSAAKNFTISSGKRRMPMENPLAQSVPNFSDLRKENTKPSSAANKITRPQVRSYAQSSKNTSDESIVREDKPRRSQSLRKSSANPSDFREMSPVDSDGVVLKQIKFDEEILKNVVTKPSLKKSSCTSFVARTSNAGEKASGVTELINNEEENHDMESGPDEFVSMVEDGDEREFESSNTEGQNALNNGEPTLGMQPEKFVNSESEDGDGSLTFSRVDQALGSNLSIPSIFHPVESMPDWSEESPVSWNSHTQNPFSYPHEMSDVDASVDSKVGSPASWNSHSLNKIETDAARMRKKWATAQNPVLVVHSSSNQSRKDITRGFKRLLKFGRKSRGSESLVDWVSATTSEGDDDTEDGKDPANRSSEDLRKSRMGYSHAQPSEDSFNESEFFNESVQSLQNSIPAPPANFKLREDHMSAISIKASRSIFSLSSFRSKGGDSKPR